MHLLSGTKNSVHWASLNAFGAADALVFSYVGNSAYGFCTVLCIQSNGLHVEQVSKSLNGSFTTGGATVDGFAIGNGFGIGAATRMTALATLCLR
jgi:hypothetical protein